MLSGYVRVLIVKWNYRYALIQYDDVLYQVPLESVEFQTNPDYGRVHKRELTQARIIQNDEE